MRRRSVTAPVALLAATVAVSASAVLVNEARTDSATVVWLRMALAVALLAPWAARDTRRETTSRRDLALTLAAGACLAVHFIAWTASLGDTSVAASVLLVSLHPLVVAPAGRALFGDRVDRWTSAGIALALAGTAVTCAGASGGGGHALRGDLLAVVGGVALAGYLLIGRARRGRGGLLRYSATVYAVVAAAAAGTAAVSGSLHVPGARTLAACAALAVVCTIGGHTVFAWTLRRLPAATVSLSFLGEPPLAAILALLVLGQRPATATVAGGVLILAGLVAVLRRPAADAPAATVTG